MIALDTHTAIWLTQDKAKLSGAARRALVEGRIEGGLAIADITLREIAMLVSYGRVSVSTPLGMYLRFVESLFRVLPVTAEIAEQSVRFSPAYPNDPADRLIGATAIVHGMKLITIDKRIRASKEVDCIW